MQIERWESFGITHAGKCRVNNEDAVLAEDHAKIWAVADGMGGHAKGEFASKLIIGALSRVKLHDTLADRFSALEEAILNAHLALSAFSASSLNGDICGATMVVFVASENMGLCLWEGDSRLYRLRQGKLQQITADHSSSTTTVTGRLSVLVSRAVGAGHSKPEACAVFFKPDDLYLLCSDGLYNELTASEIEAILITNNTVSVLCQALLSEAMSKEARDNISCVLIKPVFTSGVFFHADEGKINSLLNRLSSDYEQKKITRDLYLNKIKELISCFDSFLRKHELLSNKKKKNRIGLWFLMFKFKS